MIVKHKKEEKLLPLHTVFHVDIACKSVIPCNIMMFKSKITYIVLLLFFISSCTTPISMIVKKAEKYDGKKVKISGKVISSLRLVDIMCFTIKDRTGKICVVTENFLPLKREHLFVTGIVERNYQYEGRNMIVIKEEKIKGRKTKSWKKIKKKL